VPGSPNALLEQVTVWTPLVHFIPRRPIVEKHWALLRLTLGRPSVSCFSISPSGQIAPPCVASG